jgi:hypothetical protein
MNATTGVIFPLLVQSCPVPAPFVEERATARQRTAALLAGVPAGLLFLASVGLFIQGFPITLILLPFAAPFIALTAAQALAARATWRNVYGAARRLRWRSVLLTAALSTLLLYEAGLFVAPEDRAATSPEMAQEDAVLLGIVTVVAAMNVIAVLLLVEAGRPRWPLRTARSVGLLLAVVLLCGVLAALLLPGARTVP